MKVGRFRRLYCERGDDGSLLLYDQSCTSEEEEEWAEDGHWSSEQQQIWHDVHGDVQAFWAEWQQRLDYRRWEKQTKAHEQYKAERLRRFLDVASEEIASFEATHYTALTGRVQGAAAAVHSYKYLCAIRTVLLEDGTASWKLDLLQMKVQSVCLLEDQTLSDWTKQYMGKASVMPDKVKTAIKHLSRAPGSGHANQLTEYRCDLAVAQNHRSRHRAACPSNRQLASDGQPQDKDDDGCSAI